MSDLTLLPYKVRYSIGDDDCKLCEKRIRAGKVQMAIMMQSDDEDCHYPDWYHMKCFFKTRMPPTLAAFDGFAKLRYADQIAIREKLGIVEDIGPVTVVEGAKISNFRIESETTTLESCTGCTRNFRRDKLRIMHIDRDANQNIGPTTWFHLLCFVRLRCELGFLKSGEKLPGFNRLKAEDKERVKKSLPSIEEEACTEPHIRAEQMKEQTDEYFKLYDELQQNLQVADRIAILKANQQFLPEDEIDLLHHLTDMIFFGVLEHCAKCETGSMLFENYYYACTTVKTWGKCNNKVHTVQRQLAKIPQKLFKLPFLKRSCVKLRLLHRFRLIDDDGNDLVHAPYIHPTLFNMEFVVIGNLKKPTAEITETISKMGGKVVSEIHSKVAAVISNKEEVQRMGHAMARAKRHGIQVVSVDFLTKLEPSDPILYVISESLSEWGGDPYARIEQNDVKSRRETNFYVKSQPEKIPQKCNGFAVDFECGLDENADVYSEIHPHLGITVHYSVVLGLVDIQSNKNSYHRMQLLKSKDSDLFWVFESSGRISTCIGSKRLHTFGSKLEEARKKFNDIYKEKTGWDFGTFRHKQPQKFYHLDINTQMPAKVSNNVVETKLNKSVYELMQMMFDVKKMENMIMVGCELDLKQMPLGKISIWQIRRAMNVLKTISELIGKKESHGKLIGASNHFYTLIPHSFGVKRPTTIDTIDVVNAKSEMLESLSNMDLIYHYLNGETGEKINPLDACYPKLNTELVPIDKESNLFKKFCDIVKNTHGPTHTPVFTLEVLEAFKVVRKSEDHHFPEFPAGTPSNHVYLWHGSRVTNFVSILSNGLKIAPPEAVISGAMFGKGIYFADCVTKSAKYCATNYFNNTGLMMLCEVALGNAKSCFDACNITDIPNNEFQSVIGGGLYNHADVLNLGFPVVYSLQRRTDLGNRTALLYNEYIVYDPAQVKIKYLFKMKFNFVNKVK